MGAVLQANGCVKPLLMQPGRSIRSPIPVGASGSFTLAREIVNFMNFRSAFE
jgi:hypothetical protein